MKKIFSAVLSIAAVSLLLSACDKEQNPEPTPTPTPKSLTANVRLYFTAAADPYISYKIYAVAKNSTKTDITSKAVRTKLDTTGVDKDIYQAYAFAMWTKEEKDQLYAMVFDDTFTETGTYGYEVVFSKIPGQTVTGEVNDVYDWRIKTTESSGLEVRYSTNTEVGSFSAATIDKEVENLTKSAKRSFSIWDKQ